MGVWARAPPFCAGLVGTTDLGNYFRTFACVTIKVDYYLKKKNEALLLLVGFVSYFP